MNQGIPDKAAVRTIVDVFILRFNLPNLVEVFYPVLLQSQ